MAAHATMLHWPSENRSSPFKKKKKSTFILLQLTASHTNIIFHFTHPIPLLGLGHHHRLGSQTVAVAEEEHALAGVLGILAGLNPLAHASAAVHGADEAQGAALCVGAVVLAHDGADGIGGLVGVVKGDGGHVVVQDVGLDDAVQQLAADEAHLAVDGGGSASDKVPLLAGVVGEGRVGVLEEGDGN